MANWQRELNLLPEWAEARKGNITVHQMAAVIAGRLLALKPFGDPEGLDFDRETLAEEFDDFSTDQDLNAEDFDDLMSSLYDWADTKISGDFFNAKKVCWIKTF